MIKKFNQFCFKLNESMIMPDNYYSQFNLPVDGVKPASKEVREIDSLLNKKRRVAWVDANFGESKDEFEKRMESKGLKSIKLYNINDDIAVTKIKELSEGGWSEMAATRQVDSEYIVYLPKYEEQAKLAHKELIRRGGWWTVTEPESDIYLARLMGYGEEYIVPYIRKYHPNFDVDDYIKQNPRNKVIK
jgi:hypothetical protein